MSFPKIKKKRLQELKNYGWQYDILESGYISPDFSCIAIDNRAPYQNRLLKFNHNEEKYNKNLEWLIKNDFIEEEAQ